MSNANDNGPPTWQEQLQEQSYGEPDVVEPQSEAEPKAGSKPGADPVADVEGG